MNNLTRLITWLNTGDNAMWIYVPVLAPIFAITIMGMVGNG